PTNLIIAPIGDGNVLDSWLDRPDDRQFDLFVIDFRPGPRMPPPLAAHFLNRPGFKFEHLDFIAEHLAEVLNCYDRIWCPDDDIALDTLAINRMFALVEQHRLQLAQPAVASGDVSFQSFRPKEGAILRFSPFVEVMCPVFTREAFFRVRHTFPASRSGWGLDLAWPQFFDPREVAILDCIHVHHTRPLATGEAYARFRRFGIDPASERDEVRRHFGCVSEYVNRRMVFGKLKMPTIHDPAYHRSIWRRLRERLSRHAA
ncbi:MAG TPA: hypothetical protein VKB78_15395, partial [Pirellulales bacterium]|nr:hypothetical protein [Pirellulales bacterium]